MENSFIWREGEPLVILDESAAEGTKYVQARDVSADGRLVVGEAKINDASLPFIWSAELGFRIVNDFPTEWASAGSRAVSTDGSVISGYARIAGSNGSIGRRFYYLWTEVDGYTEAPLVRGGLISDSGDVIASDGTHLDRWLSNDGRTQATYNFQPYDLTADAFTVVGENRPSLGYYEASIWDPVNGLRNLQSLLEERYHLDLNGWTLTRANGISADGRTIVGTGTNPDGQIEAWLATIAPLITENNDLEGLLGGRGLTTDAGGADLLLTDRVGEQYEIEIDDLTTLGELMERVDSATSGHLTLDIDIDRLVLSDHTGGENSLSVADASAASRVASQLGLAAEGPFDRVFGANLLIPEPHIILLLLGGVLIKLGTSGRSRSVP